MTDASQVRINELARELEVKAKAIIDLLPGYGVTEKKTHSSSIPVDVAEKVRHKLKNEAADEAAAEVDREAKDAAAKAAARRPVAPAATVSSASAAPPAEINKPAPVAAPTVAPAASAPAVAPVTAPPTPKPAAPAPAAVAPSAPAAPVARPAAPAAPIAARPTAPAAPAAPTSAPGVRPNVPGGAGAAPRPAQQHPTQQHPTRPGGPPPVNRPGSPAPGARPASGAPGTGAPSQNRPGQTGSQPQAARPANTQPAGQPRPQMPLRPMPTGNRGPVPGTVPGSRPTGPRPGQPMRPQHSSGQGQGARSFPQRSGGPGGPGGAPNRPYSPRPGAPSTGTRPGPGSRGPGAGRPNMLPPIPDKAEPGKPLYARRPQQRQRPIADKREQEGERKLHPTRQRPGAGGRGIAAVVAPPEPRAPRDITLTEGITIRELAEKLDIRAKDLLKTLLDRGVFASINQALDVHTATELAQSFNGVVSVVSFEEEMVLEVAKEETRENLKPRFPVVTVMGHVDHGKTSLLDAIRSEEVAAGEAGGITQHIGAYKVKVDENRSVVFVDTPGHEAFTRMRARGAKVTDIVVLVVAADDGVMPQTREAIDHARAANVPIIVAINKIDKPEAQVDRVKRQLSELNLMPSEWGGETEFVEVSAKQKKNLDKLLEIILTVADLRELKANPDAPASGTVLESRVDKGRGPVATILVQNGTLNTSDFFIAGSVFGKVRAMFDDHGRPVKIAPPSTPVEVLGLQGVPEAGDHFQVTDEAKAKHLVEYRQSKQRDAALRASAGGRITLDQLHEQLKTGEVKELPIVIKADVQGSAQVLGEMLPKLSTDQVKLKIISEGVGAVTENDVLLASASGAIIIAFGVKPDRKASDLAHREGVDIRTYTIIYEVSDEIKKAMEGLLEPVFQEAYLGRAEVRNTFRVKGSGTVAGCYVVDGVMKRDSQIRVMREGVVVHTGKLSSLKRFKDDASEVRTGFECGLGIANFNDVKVGDTLECFQVTKLSGAEAASQGTVAARR